MLLSVASSDLHSEMNEGTAVVSDESVNDDDRDGKDRETNYRFRPESTDIPLSAHFSRKSDLCGLVVSDNTTRTSSIDLQHNIEKQYPIHPFLFKDKPLTPELIRLLIEHRPCQPELKDRAREN